MGPVQDWITRLKGRRSKTMTKQITRLKAELKEHGIKGLVKRRGWRLVLAVFVVYLIRDVVLYVLIPLAVYWGVVK